MLPIGLYRGGHTNSTAFSFTVLFFVCAFFLLLGSTTNAEVLNLSEQEQKEALRFLLYSDILDDGSFSVLAYDSDVENAFILRCSGERECRRVGQFSLNKDSSTGHSDLASVINPTGSVVAGRFRKNRELFRWTDKTGLRSIGTPYLRADAIIGVPPIDISHDGSVILGTWWLWIENEGFRELGDRLYARALSADGSAVAGRRAGRRSPRALRWTRSSGSHQLLGDLKGRGRRSIADDISDDGATVIGSGNRRSTFEVGPRTKTSTPYRWTAQNGFEILNKGNYEIGVTTLVSGNGAIVMGGLRNREDYDLILVCWNAEGKRFDLRDLLSQAGIMEEQYQRFSLRSISNSGRFIILGAHPQDSSTFFVDFSGTALFP